MSVVNISIPSKLKSQVQELVELGVYSSFSDAVRDALRKLIEKDFYGDFIQEAKKQEAAGQKANLKPEEIEEIFSKLE